MGANERNRRVYRSWTNRAGIQADNNDGWQIADCNVGLTFSNGEATELSFDEKRANAKFIAHAREDIPRLLSALKAAEAEIERLRTERANLAEALRYYANRQNYEGPAYVGGFEEPGEVYKSWIDRDRGQRARDTLKELGLEG